MLFTDQPSEVFAFAPDVLALGLVRARNYRFPPVKTAPAEYRYIEVSLRVRWCLRVGFLARLFVSRAWTRPVRIGLVHDARS